VSIAFAKLGEKISSSSKLQTQIAELPKKAENWTNTHRLKSFNEQLRMSSTEIIFSLAYIA